MNKKRAEGLPLNMIIIAAIGLIVLVVVVIIFKTSVGSSAKGYKETADKAIQSAEGERCQTFFSTRRCSTNSPEPIIEWRKVNPTKDKWSDCNENCWERI